MKVTSNIKLMDEKYFCYICQTLGGSNGKLSLSTAQDAAYQRHTSRLTELWSLPKRAQELNTYNNNANLQRDIIQGVSRL